MEGVETSVEESQGSPALTYELIRENRALLLNLAEAERTVLGLRLDAIQRELDKLELNLGLQHASAEVSKLQVALAAVRQPSSQTGVGQPGAS